MGDTDPWGVTAGEFLRWMVEMLDTAEVVESCSVVTAGSHEHLDVALETRERFEVMVRRYR